MRIAKTRTLGAAALLGSLLTQTTVPAAAQQTPTPGMVRIDTCQVVRARKADYVAPYRGLAISYVNTGTAPLGRIEFTVRYSGAAQTLVDTGYFSHNAKIRHRYDAFGHFPVTAAEPVCLVTAVRLAPPRHIALATQQHGDTQRKRKHHHFLFFSWWS